MTVHPPPLTIGDNIMQDTIGDFEPDLDILNLLVSPEGKGIAEDLPIVVPSNPITSLLNYELPVRKPSPSPVPIMQQQGSGKIRLPSRPRKRKSTELAASDSQQPQQQDQSPQSPLDDKDTFKLFDVGWILPEATRRGGRPPPSSSSSQSTSHQVSPAPALVGDPVKKVKSKQNDASRISYDWTYALLSARSSGLSFSTGTNQNQTLLTPNVDHHQLGGLDEQQGQGQTLSARTNSTVGSGDGPPPTEMSSALESSAAAVGG